MIIQYFILFYFLVNVFISGYIYNEFHGQYKKWYLIILCIFYALFALPIIFITSLWSVLSDLFWNIYNFLYIGYLIKYFNGSWDRLEQWQINKITEAIPNVKYWHQKYILKLILNKQNKMN